MPSQNLATRAASKQNALLAIICISYFMVILDNSIIFTGLPQIEHSMGFSPTSLAWVTDAYVLVFGGFLLLGARAGDLLGRRRVFITGLFIFGVASVLVGVAPFASFLIAARAIQGIGAAILAPSSLALLTENFAEGRERARAVAAYAAVAGIGASAGLVIGGFLTDEVSWRAGFFLNAPIAIVMIVAARRIVKETPRHRGRFDLAGAFSATLGMTLLVFGIIHAAEAGWSAPVTIAALLLGVVMLVVFVLNEARVAQPIMPLRLFASLERVGAYLTRFLYLGAMMGFFFFTVQYMQGVLGFSPLRAGFGFLPMSAVNFAVAIVVTRIVRKLGANWVLIGGVVFTLVGMAWLSQVGASSSYLLAVALPMFLIGGGQGLAFAPMTSAGLAGVEGSDAGAASGVINTFHQVGSAFGLSILVAVSAAAVPVDATGKTALLDRVNSALTGSSVLLAIALAVVLGFIARRAVVAHKGSQATVPTDVSPELSSVAS
jgi:EmrB/QacA subfamily drug resistance transporter